MIINFSVQNFGPIKDKQTLSFEADKSTHLEDHYIIQTKTGHRLLKLGLIYGANASGKTTIIKAINFLRDLVLEPEEKKTTPLKYDPFLFDQDTPTMPTLFSIEFIQHDIRYYYEVQFNKKAILREELYYFNRAKTNIFKRTTDLENQFSEISFGNKFSIDKSFKKTLESNTLWNNTVLGGFLKTNIEITALKEVQDWFEHHLSPIVLSVTALDAYVNDQIDAALIQKQDVVQILKKADLNISDIILKKEATGQPGTLLENHAAASINIELEHTVQSQKYNLPFHLESQGTQRYYGLAGLLTLFIKRDVIIPIDELESSLHPDLFTHFLLAFLINSKTSQLIATTHNREILNNRDVFRNDAIWFTHKDENSATQLYALADFDTSIVRDTSNIYNAYKIGKLGGVPNLGDFYIDLSHAE